MSTEDDGLDLCNPLGLSDLSLFKQLFQTVRCAAYISSIYFCVGGPHLPFCHHGAIHFMPRYRYTKTLLFIPIYVALDFATLRDRCCNCHANLIHVLPPQEMSDFNGYFSMLLGAYQHWQQHDNLNLANIDFEASMYVPLYVDMLYIPISSTNALYSITKRSQLCGASMVYTFCTNRNSKSRLRSTIRTNT